MWLGKIPLIMYLFSISLLFSGYYIDLAFGQNLFTSVTVSNSNSTTTKNTFDYMKELLAKNKIEETTSTELIFGDFLAASRVIFSIVTGEPVAAAFNMLPNFDEVWMVMIQIIFTTSSVALWAYLIAGRML